VMDVLRTHPLGDRRRHVAREPFYVPPDEMLAELQARSDVGRTIAEYANRSGIPSARREGAVSQWAMRSGTEA
jgi:hypothetical protein